MAFSAGVQRAAAFCRGSGCPRKILFFFFSRRLRRREREERSWGTAPDPRLRAGALNNPALTNFCKVRLLRGTEVVLLCDKFDCLSLMAYHEKSGIIDGILSTLVVLKNQELAQ